MATKHTIQKTEPSAMNNGNADIDVQLSIVIAVRDPHRAAPMEKLFREYKEQIEKTGLHYEFIFVIEGDHPSVIDTLTSLKENGEKIKIFVFAKWYGDATSLSAGLDHATGSLVLTLPAYHQIDPEAIPSIIESMNRSDMIIVRRWPRADGAFTRFQVRAFHAVLRKMLGFNFNDLGCSVRLMKKKVIESVQIYGDQHRFYPVLASHNGFKVKEVDAPQTNDDTFQKHFSVSLYINRLLDLLSIFFLAKFTKKPLRFFGFTGLVVLVSGL